MDPFFLDAFQQQPSTPTYDKLLSSLPRAFVGTAPELKQLVALLTAQSIRAYAHNVSAAGQLEGKGEGGALVIRQQASGQVVLVHNNRLSIVL